MFSWSSSPALLRIYKALEEYQQTIDQLRAYLEQTLTPFQNHVFAQRRHVERSLEHLESRLTPLRECVQGETENLTRVTAHLETDLPEHFEAFEHCLASQRALLEQANHYMEEQPRPLQTYLEDECKIAEEICSDLGQKFERFLQNLSEQQQTLDLLRHVEVNSEYDALITYLEDRQKAFQRYIRSFEYRPQEFFAQLDEAAQHYKRLNLDHRGLSDRIFEETRMADRRLKDALPIQATSPSEHTEETAA